MSLLLTSLLILCVLQKLVTDWLHACYQKAFLNSIVSYFRPGMIDPSCLTSPSPFPFLASFLRNVVVRKMFGSTLYINSDSTIKSFFNSVLKSCPELYNSSSSDVVIELVPLRSRNAFRTEFRWLIKSFV